MPSARSLRSSPKPSMPGIMTSRMIASGRTSRALSRAAAPLDAVCTSKPWNFKLTDRSSTMLASSSTTRTRASGTLSGIGIAMFLNVHPFAGKKTLRTSCALPVSSMLPCP